MSETIRAAGGSLLGSFAHDVQDAPLWLTSAVILRYTCAPIQVGASCWVMKATTPIHLAGEDLCHFVHDVNPRLLRPKKDVP
jgi:hypothetical protein